MICHNRCRLGVGWLGIGSSGLICISRVCHNVFNVPSCWSLSISVSELCSVKAFLSTHALCSDLCFVWLFAIEWTTFGLILLEATLTQQEDASSYLQRIGGMDGMSYDNNDDHADITC
jgi:hypothetical protein